MLACNCYSLVQTKDIHVFVQVLKIKTSMFCSLLGTFDLCQHCKRFEKKLHKFMMRNFMSEKVS